MSWSSDCQRATRRGFFGMVFVLIAAPLILILLSHGKPLAVVIGLFFVPAIVRAVILYRSIRQPERQEQLEEYWQGQSRPKSLATLFIIGSLPRRSNASDQTEEPLTAGADEYRMLLQSNRNIVWAACLIMCLGLPPVFWMVNSAANRPFHWDSLMIPIGVPLILAILNTIRTARERKDLSHFNQWIAEGRPKQFDPWQSKTKQR